MSIDVLTVSSKGQEEASMKIVIDTNVVISGHSNEDYTYSAPRKTCPLCGYPMQLKYKRAYGLRLFICSNEPEVCGFMTNDLRGGKMAIQKCEKCRDGYLVVKYSQKNGFFLGCTNYTRNGMGCDKSIGMKYYYEQMGYSMEQGDDFRRHAEISTAYL